MKVNIIEEKCIACGLCYNEYGKVFGSKDDGIAYVLESTVPTDLEDEARDGISICPTDAIEEIK